MMRISRHEFEHLVAQALDDLPPPFAERLENIAVFVEEEPTAADLDSAGFDPQEDDLLGLYQGVPLAERGSSYNALPDRVVIYRGPLLRCCESRRELIREVRDTVLHELGHHFGLDEDELPY